jgi:hypothetical protein
MNYEQQDLDTALIILGLGYASSLVMAVGWVASFVL